MNVSQNEPIKMFHHHLPNSSRSIIISLVATTARNEHHASQSG